MGVKISIWQNANYLPKDKKDKTYLSYLVSNPYMPTTVEVATSEELIKYITSYCWSPSIFNGCRHNDNFVSCDFMTIDIDSGLTIEESEKRIQLLGLCALCLPSPSYTPEDQRHRIVFPLSRTIYNKEVFDNTWKHVQMLFPELDEQASDYARFYIMSKMDDGFFQDGVLLEPVVPVEKPKKVQRYDVGRKIPVDADIQDIVKYIYKAERDTIPEAVSFFIKNANSGLPGKWINSLNSFVFSLSLSGIEEDVIFEVVEKLAPESLDKKDIYQITRSIRDGIKTREINESDVL